jgi:hypothetical protein
VFADHALGAILSNALPPIQGEIQMQRKTVEMIALAGSAPALALGAARHAQAQDAKNPYPTSMAPIDQYLMTDRNAEIALSRSAAPPSIGKDATVNGPRKEWL